jgi:hypothetical protein
LSDAVTEGTVRWLPSDAYALAFGNKLEYSGRVREVEKNVRPVPRTTQTYYTPTQGRSQHAKHSTPVSQEEINQACALILEAERGAHVAEVKVILERERKAAEERFNVLWARCETKLRSRLSHNTSTTQPLSIPSRLSQVMHLTSL